MHTAFHGEASRLLSNLAHEEVESNDYDYQRPPGPSTPEEEGQASHNEQTEQKQVQNTLVNGASTLTAEAVPSKGEEVHLEPSAAVATLLQPPAIDVAHSDSSAVVVPSVAVVDGGRIQTLPPPRFGTSVGALLSSDELRKGLLPGQLPVWWHAPFFDHTSFGVEALALLTGMIR